MRRAILILVLYLALGLVTSVAVAWVAAVVLQAADLPTRQYLLFGLADDAAIQMYGRPTHDGASWNVYYQSTPFASKSIPNWSVFSDEPGPGDWVVLETGSGWPQLCLRAERHQPTPKAHPFSFRSDGWMLGGISFPWPRWDWPRVDHVPTKLIWSGFAINTLFWAACWSIIAMAPTIWRYNRSKRWLPKNKCGWCGYPIAVTQGKLCSECGHDRHRPPKLTAMPSWIIGVIALMAVLVATLSFAFVFREKDFVQPIHHASYNGDTETVRKELDRGVDPDLIARVLGDASVPLVLAIEGGHAQIAHMLLDAGADPTLGDNRGHLPLTLAAEQGDIKLVQSLLDAGADPNQIGHENRNALMWAAAIDSVELARLLIEAGANPSIQAYDTPLNAAASADMIEFLLDAGADPSSANAGYSSPLVTVLLKGRRDLAERLVAGGLQPDSSTLGMAISWTDVETVRWLIDAGADPTAQEHQGRSLFGSVHYASTDRALWLYLLELGAGVDDTFLIARRETTPLWNTVLQPEASAELVQFLLDHGADPMFVGLDDQTCIDVARRDDIRQLLVDAAAERDAGNGEGD